MELDPALRILPRSLNSLEVGRDLYLLYCIYSASRSLIQRSDGLDGCPFWEMRDSFEEDEVIKKFISVAINIRILHEDFVSKGIDLDPAVGHQVKNIKKGEKDPLTLRQACSKIIHAKAIKLHRRYQYNPSKAFLLPEITLHSDDQKKSGWRAKIKVFEFIFAGYEYCRINL